MKAFILAFIVAIAGCASVQQMGLPSPEAQIAAGSQAGRAVTATARRLQAENKITVVQAKSYLNMLTAANASLHDADTDLRTCRTATASTAQTRPDPCWAKVEDIVRIALENIAGMKKTLDTK